MKSPARFVYPVLARGYLPPGNLRTSGHATKAKETARGMVQPRCDLCCCVLCFDGCIVHPKSAYFQLHLLIFAIKNFYI